MLLKMLLMPRAADGMTSGLPGHAATTRPACVSSWPIVWRIVLAVAVGVALVTAVLVGAWEIHQLDKDVQTLQAEVEQGAQATARFDSAHKALKAQAVKLREADLRQEFYAPLYAYETQVAVAVQTGYTECAGAKRLWQQYVNDKLVPFLKERENREVLLAVRRDDPDYHATLLNSLPVAC